MAFENIHTKYRGRRKTLPAGEMAEMLRDGLTLDELAEALDASPRTITQRLSEGGWGFEGHPNTRAPKVDVLAGLAIAHVPQGDWVLQALCAQVDNEIFFPDKGGSTLEGKRICEQCPVAAECLDYALENNERFGIWGGLSERERRKLSAPTHTEPCPDECGQMFANAANAARHAVVAHRRAPVTCPDCGQSCGHQGALTQHQRAAHPAAS